MLISRFRKNFKIKCLKSILTGKAKVQYNGTPLIQTHLGPTPSDCKTGVLITVDVHYYCFYIILFISMYNSYTTTVREAATLPRVDKTLGMDLKFYTYNT